jgi:hypothetical protein
MRYLNYLLILVVALSLLTACGTKKKEMTIQDFAKIEEEVAIPEPDLDPAKVEQVAKKYGFTFDQYKEFFEKVQDDPELQEKLGELTLENQKPAEK